MAQVSVKDVSEIRLFSQGVQAFRDKYEYQLILVEQATTEDISTAKRMLEILEKKLEAAEMQLRASQQALHNYIESQSGRRDKDGNPIPLDQHVIKQLTEAVTQAEEHLVRSKRRYDEGKDESWKACVALEMAASAATSGRGVIHDCVATACSAIDRAAIYIESYRV